MGAVLNRPDDVIGLAQRQPIAILQLDGYFGNKSIAIYEGAVGGADIDNGQHVISYPQAGVFRRDCPILDDQSILRIPADCPIAFAAHYQRRGRLP